MIMTGLTIFNCAVLRASDQDREVFVNVHFNMRTQILANVCFVYATDAYWRSKQKRLYVFLQMPKAKTYKNWSKTVKRNVLRSSYNIHRFVQLYIRACVTDGNNTLSENGC